MTDKSKKEAPSLGLYIHVPFCRSLCPYCSFYSVPASGQAMERWLKGILKELNLIRPFLQQGVLTSIYIGGGTPSALPQSLWEVLLGELTSFISKSPVEYTVEANPESLTDELLELWIHHGVNRVSLGVQSLDQKVLRRAGRRHNVAQALSALGKVQTAGLRCSCDLMFGLPDQTFRSWASSLSELVKTGVDHLSIYQLTLDPGCAWSKRPPENRLDGYNFYRWAQWYLVRKGFRQYEIASFARPGEESRHNSAYWKGQNVLGIGPAAWGLWKGKRYANWNTLESWCRSLNKGQRPIASWEKLKGADVASERAILALRTSEGIDLEAFQEHFGDSVAQDLQKRLMDIPAHLLLRQGGKVALSPQGMRVGNSIWCELLSLGTACM